MIDGSNAQKMSPLKAVRNFFARSGKLPIKPKYIVHEASRIAQDDSIEAATAFLEKYGTDDQKRASHLLRANAAQTDAEWKQHMDAFLARWNLAPIQLRPGHEKRFYRLKSEPSKTIQDERRISIIMPAYNCQSTVPYAAGSILSQTWSNLELIIVDDASTDGTWSTLQALATKDARVHILRNSVNVGPYVSKNRALSIATGDYITVHDADDWALPERIERQLQDILENGAKATIGHLLRVNEDLQCHQLGSTPLKSHDGASRLAYMSCFFKAKPFREMLGSWDCVRFGADHEILARARLAYGSAFHSAQRITMFALDIGANLTRDPTYGLYVKGRPSSTRDDYKSFWRAWHETMPRAETYLEFPQIRRKFPAPDVMQVAPSDVNAVLAEE